MKHEFTRFWKYFQIPHDVKTTYAGPPLHNTNSEHYMAARYLQIVSDLYLEPLKEYSTSLRCSPNRIKNTSKTNTADIHKKHNIEMFV